MAAGIFISYRREESRYAAGRLADDLGEAFGVASIFRDIEGIEPGVDFTQALDMALAGCVTMLVLIGPNWLNARDAAGRRRLDAEGDWIRLEIASALAREGVRVIPVLLEGATLPAAEDLAAELKPLVRRQALELADARWRADLNRLIETLARVPGLKRVAAPRATAAGRTKPMLIGAAAGVVGLVAVALWFGEEPEPAQEPIPAPSPQDQPGPAALPDPEPQATAEPPPNPVPTPRAPADLSGLWRTNSGEVYHFEQSGRDLRFSAEAAGQPMGQGQGSFDGTLLRLSFTMFLNGVAMHANCNLQPAPDLQSLTGMCSGPNGAFPAHMFR